jgi:cyclic 2,3-diphosphoglycerate synthetase
VVVDGEHYPPVVASALAELAADGHEILAAVLVGGREKLPTEGVEAYGDVRVVLGEDARDALAGAIEEHSPDAVFDLSDEPVLDYRRRTELASVALAMGVAYEGADFSFSPPRRERIAAKPSLEIIGTGKRTGKTAVAGYAARALVAAGYRPIVVAMGRGGPPEPEVLRGDDLELTPHDLLELAEAGKHAASDYIEDAFLGRVPTVGCRRCGGGIAGGVEFSNVRQGVEIANELDGDTLILEGSGSALPPVAPDASCLIVPASVPPGYIAGYFGPYRLLIADVVVVTMCEEPFGSPSKISSLVALIESAWRRAGLREDREGLRVVRTVFRPKPTRDVEGARVFVTTTAPEVAGDNIRKHLESAHGCEVVGISHSLSDRGKLERELKDVGDRADVLLCEIKAAAVDVATRRALDAGLEVVYMDNVPRGVDGDDPKEAIEWLARSAHERFER